MDLRIEYVEKEELKPYANNAKIHTAEQIEQIKRSIYEFGMNDPIAVWHDNEIIEGHGRLLAVMEMPEIKTVPIIRLDNLTDEQRRAYMLVHNKLTMNTDFDLDLLDLELDNISDIDMTNYGFDEVSFDEPEDEENSADEDELPEEVETRCKLGDIWQLGKHRLICGDCTNSDVIQKLMDGKKADISFSSTPYNAGQTVTEQKAGKLTKYNDENDSKTEGEYIRFINDYLKCALDVSEYVFMNMQSLSGNKLALIDVLYHNKDTYADTIIWDKQNTQPAMGQNVLNSTFEYVHIFSHKANRAIGTIQFRGTIDNILHMPPQRHNEYHETHNATFSVEFASWFIKNFAANSVLDNFGGTGTTMIACEQLKKKCFMCELNESYCDIIIQRWENFTGKQAIKLD